MSDRTLGYIALALLSAVLLGLLGYGANQLANPPHTRLISLDHIGSLQIDDPLRMRGAQIGHISAITTHAERVLLTVSLADPVDIHRDYRISVAEKGILGERYLVLEPGEDTTALLDEHDTLVASFAPGIAEIMGQAWKLEPTIRKLRGQVEQLRLGRGSSPSLIARMQTAFAALDSFSLRLQTASQSLRDGLGGGMQRLDSLLVTTDRSLAALATASPELLQDLQQSLTELTATIAGLERALDQITAVTRRFNDPQNPLWNDQLARLQEELQAIRLIIAELNESALRLKLRISFTR